MSKRVLVVEDNELNLRLFCELLRAHNYEVEGLRDGRDVLDRARMFMPDLIIMDILLPHITGLDLIEAIRADVRLHAMPIMVVTAYAGKADENTILAAGADAYVPKPISLMRFVATAEALVNRHPASTPQY